jgi:hypothetical protein
MANFLPKLGVYDQNPSDDSFELLTTQTIR